MGDLAVIDVLVRHGVWMNRVFLGLAGRRGSGKTTVARALEAKHGFKRASFGDYVRSTAEARALPSDVSSLERLGQSLIDDLGWDRFCAAVLAPTLSESRVVVDGIRHVAARTTISRLIAPAALLIVFLEVDESERLRRVASRGRPNDYLTGHEMTDELPLLRKRAEIVVRSDDDDAAISVIEQVETLVPGWTR